MANACDLTKNVCALTKSICGLTKNICGLVTNFFSLITDESIVKSQTLRAARDRTPLEAPRRVGRSATTLRAKRLAFDAVLDCKKAEKFRDKVILGFLKAIKQGNCVVLKDAQGAIAS